MSLALETRMRSEPPRWGKPSGKAELRSGRGSGTPFFRSFAEIFCKEMGLPAKHSESGLLLLDPGVGQEFARPWSCWEWGWWHPHFVHTCQNTTAKKKEKLLTQIENNFLPSPDAYVSQESKKFWTEPFWTDPKGPQTRNGSARASKTIKFEGCLGSWKESSFAWHLLACLTADNQCYVKQSNLMTSPVAQDTWLNMTVLHWRHSPNSRHPGLSFHLTAVKSNTSRTSHNSKKDMPTCGCSVQLARWKRQHLSLSLAKTYSALWPCILRIFLVHSEGISYYSAATCLVHIIFACKMQHLCSDLSKHSRHVCVHTDICKTFFYMQTLCNRQSLFDGGPVRITTPASSSSPELMSCVGNDSLLTRFVHRPTTVVLHILQPSQKGHKSLFSIIQIKTCKTLCYHLPFRFHTRHELWHEGTSFCLADDMRIAWESIAAKYINVPGLTPSSTVIIARMGEAKVTTVVEGWWMPFHHMIPQKLVLFQGQTKAFVYVRIVHFRLCEV